MTGAERGFVLGIDTAAPVVGAALWSPVGSREWSLRVVRGADAALVPAVGELLDDVGDSGATLLAVAVVVGPGAFTGLRVGVATALGVAVARGVPVVPLSSLEVRAAMAGGSRVLAMLDARKQRIYAGLFDASGEQPVALGPERDVAPEAALPPAPFTAVGEGAAVFRAQVEQAGGAVVADPQRVPALEVARLGWLRREAALDAGEVALRYLREADARLPAGAPPGR